MCVFVSGREYVGLCALPHYSTRQCVCVRRGSWMGGWGWGAWTDYIEPLARAV